jgi:hypothetical protein
MPPQSQSGNVPTKRDETPQNVGLEPAPTADRASPSLILGGALALALMGAGAWLGRRRWQQWLYQRGWLKAFKVALGGAERVNDSDDFVEALNVWHDVIAFGDPNPRGIKRFANRVRYLAMMESEQGEERIPDALLVALGALHHAGLSYAKDQSGDEKIVVESEIDKETRKITFGQADATHPVLKTAMDAIAKTKDWPPTDAQLLRFKQLVQGMHVR